MGILKSHDDDYKTTAFPICGKGKLGLFRLDALRVHLINLHKCLKGGKEGKNHHWCLVAGQEATGTKEITGGSV